MSAKLLIIGLMSGTSADGVDAALTEISGQGLDTRVRLLGHVHRPFSETLRRAILDACDPNRCRVDRLCVLGTALAHEYAEAAREVAHSAGLAMGRVDALACHGQTVWHQPEPLGLGDAAWRGTMQIGSAAELAARTGVPVVSDFRSADMAAGGQGAPLVPYADYVLFASRDEHRAVQNIGGIANVTHLPADAGPSSVLAFDTGPGNMVIDEVVRQLTCGAQEQDTDGIIAAQGRICQEMVNEIMESEPFFAQPPPRSTGRERFGRRFVTERFLPAARARHLSDCDIVATATALTAQSIARAYEQWLQPRGWPERVIVGGGGARNPTLMHMLKDLLQPARIETHADHGIPDGAKEALAFAVLAYETLHGRPANLPSATGASRPVVLGSITPAPGRGFPPLPRSRA